MAAKTNVAKHKLYLEAKLTIITFISFTCLTGSFLLLIYTFSNPEYAGYLFDYVYALGDLLALSNPYLLLAFSSEMRTCFVKAYFPCNAHD